MKNIILIMILAVISIARTISFGEALELTLLNNKELKAKELDNKKSEISLKEANGYKIGKLEFVENVSRTNHAGYVFGMKLASREATFGDFGFDEFISQFNTITPGAPGYDGGSSVLATEPDNLNNPKARNNFETKLVYEVPLYVGGKLSSASNMAKLQIKANNAKLSHDKKHIGLEVLKAYNGAVTAKEFIKMIENASVITARFSKLAKNLYDNRLARGLDVKQSKMATLSMNAKLKEAETKFELAISYLQFLTTDKTITDVGEFIYSEIDEKNINLLQAMAIKQRDDYVWMKYNTKTMKEKIDFDSSDLYPTVGAHIEYGTNDNTLNFNDASKKDYYMLAVGLNYSLFDGGVSSSKKQKAKIDYYKTKYCFEHMRDGINLEVKKNLLNLKSESEILEKKLKIEFMSKKILNETENIYKNNLKFRTNMMYLLMQLQNMLMSQSDVIMSKYNKSITSAKLRLSIGKSLQTKGVK